MRLRMTLLGLWGLISMLAACGPDHKEPAKPKAAEKSVSTDAHRMAATHPVINSPDDALRELKAGNQRFRNNEFVNNDYAMEIEETKAGQKPHSLILSCMDSRVPPEIIFDQGIGHIFVTRVAGNIDDDDISGSMEYAVEHAGAKLIVVMGHTQCGAVKGAIANAKLGNLTQLIAKIRPAIPADSHDPNIVFETVKNNVKLTIADILHRSDVIREFVEAKKVAIVGAYYDIETGTVTFME
ncbi:MAG: carbonic anhydrase [Candidatus Kapaibacterium sp.]